MNRRSGFCRPLPCHLATSPFCSRLNFTVAKWYQQAGRLSNQTTWAGCRLRIAAACWILQTTEHDMKTDRLHDRILYCDCCGISFLWSAEEQHAEQATPSSPHPQRCPGCRRLVPAPGRERGLVKWFHRRKSFGFIVRAGKPDLFVHGSALPPGARLQPGDLVEFAVETGPRGSLAATVALLAPSGPPEE